MTELGGFTFLEFSQEQWRSSQLIVYRRGRQGITWRALTRASWACFKVNKQKIKLNPELRSMDSAMCNLSYLCLTRLHWLQWPAITLQSTPTPQSTAIIFPLYHFMLPPTLFFPLCYWWGTWPDHHLSATHVSIKKYTWINLPSCSIATILSRHKVQQQSIWKDVVVWEAISEFKGYQ